MFSVSKFTSCYILSDVGLSLFHGCKYALKFADFFPQVLLAIDIGIVIFLRLSNFTKVTAHLRLPLDDVKVIILVVRR